MTQFGSHIKIDQYLKSNIKVCNFRTTIITQDTEIKIWFDSSGSMPGTNNDLIEMRDTVLKETLLPFYNDDEALYDEKVTTNNFSNEDTFNRLATEPTKIEDGIINIIFQDEAQNIYHSSTNSFDDTTRTSSYDNDITTLRDKLDNIFVSNGYQGLIFQIEGNSGFRSFLQAVENGTNAYGVPYGLSDKDDITFNYNVARGAGPQHYADLIEAEVL